MKSCLVQQYQVQGFLPAKTGHVILVVGSEEGTWAIYLFIWPSNNLLGLNTE